MTNAAHTPGPWKVVDRGGDYGEGLFILADDAGECQIAEINTENVIDDATPDADARLIAAAPDLLAALRTTLEWLPYDQQCRGSDVVDHMECPGCAARAAIRKATGDPNAS